MSNADVFGMAVKNLWKRKLRTCLTLIGVIVGVISILGVISTALANNLNYTRWMEGKSKLTIIEIQTYEGYNGTAGAIVLDDELLDTIEQIDGVELVTPVVENMFPLNAVSGRYVANLNVIGIRPEAMAALGYKIKEGAFLSSDSNQFEIVYGANVIPGFISNAERQREQNNWRRGGRMIMVGGGSMQAETTEEAPNVDIFKDRITASYQYAYGSDKPEYPENKTPDIYNLTGVGILEMDEADWRTTSYCFMDIKKIQEIDADRLKYEKNTGLSAYGNRTTFGYQQGFVKCESVYAIETVMAEMYQLGFQEYELYNETTWINEMRQTSAGMQLFLAVLGGIAFFVAAIGIANTMFMAIYERTREIGIMKVIGAAIRDIQKLFLLEAAMIGFIGGILGLGASFLLSFILNHVGLELYETIVPLPETERLVSYIPLWLALSSLAFATLIGVISGYFPARRAMKLSALSAIKTE